jgi:hypothetical protein
MKTIEGYLAELPQPTRAHAENYDALRWHPDGNVPWWPARSAAEDADRFSPLKSSRPFYGCQYCGSMHPQELAAAIRAGARIHWSDFKYGWPHKVYVDNAPNRYEGDPELCGGVSFCGRPKQEEIDAGKWVRYQDGFSRSTGEPTYSYHSPLPPPTPASATAHGKFYSVHLKDATPEDREVIERAMGKSFEFKDGGVRWWPFTEVKPSGA